MQFIERKKSNYGLRHKSKEGFTLLELLIVSAALAVISLAIYATFNSGIKIWQKINITVPEEDLNIFFIKFTSDLKNSFTFNDINFLGREDSIEFPTLVHSPRLGKKTVGQMIYSYDYNKGILQREQRDFSQIYNDEAGVVTLSLDNITRLKFHYYAYDEDTKEYFWQEEWFSEGAPVAVMMELKLDYGTQTKVFKKTVTIPVGS
jgi:prepilin-type N-terminal cleavage/methylation domain-containing protein